MTVPICQLRVLGQRTSCSDASGFAWGKGWDNIRRLKDLETDGFEGVIVGRALYSGAFTMREALA